MIKHFCDACGKEFINLAHLNKVYIRTQKPMTETTVEICPVCFVYLTENFLPIIGEKRKAKINDARKKNPECSD